jgi:hypothetical protein
VRRKPVWVPTGEVARGWPATVGAGVVVFAVEVLEPAEHSSGVGAGVAVVREPHTYMSP